MIEIKIESVFDDIAESLEITPHTHNSDFGSLVNHYTKPLFYCKLGEYYYKCIFIDDFCMNVRELKYMLNNYKDKIDKLILELEEMKSNTILIEEEDKAYLLLKYKGV